MIEMHKTDSDDPEFLDLVVRVIEGTLDANGTRKLHVVHIDNWFDHKWLQFAGKALGAVGVRKEGKHLAVPAFTPNRVLSHRYYERQSPGAVLNEVRPPADVHVRTGGARTLAEQRRIADVAPSAALVWYSSNTKINRRGAIMAYVPTEADYDTWYASLTADPIWRTMGTKLITKPQFDALTQSNGRDEVQQGDATDAVSRRR